MLFSFASRQALSHVYSVPKGEGAICWIANRDELDWIGNCHHRLMRADKRLKRDDENPSTSLDKLI